MQPQDETENQTTSLNLNSENLQMKGLNLAELNLSWQTWLQNERMRKLISKPLQLNPKPTDQ